MKHTLSVLVENKPGVLSRVAGLFTRRGYNIDSLAVSPTEDPDRSRMTIAVDASRFPVEQITKQLDKLVNVIKIRDMDPENAVSREMALMKVAADARTRSEVIQLVEIFEARIIDVTPESLTIQVTGRDRRAHQLRAAASPVRPDRAGEDRRRRARARRVHHLSPPGLPSATSTPPERPPCRCSTTTTPTSSS